MPTTSSGVAVTEETSLALSAVWSAVNLLGVSVAQLPFQVFKRGESGKSIDRAHPVYSLVHENPNDFQSKFTFFQTMMNSVLLWGNAYAIITKDALERPVSLDIIHPSDVEVVVKNMIWYKVANRTNLVPSRNMIHILGFSTNGIVGKSPIQIARENIGLGLAAQKQGSYFFKNGSSASGVLEVAGKLDDNQYDRLRQMWMSRNTGVENTNKPVILEGGMVWKPITIPPDQAQFLETRQFQIADVARIFNVPPHMIGDLSAATYSNIEQQSIQFVQYSLMPWIKRIEEELTRKLFYESEKADYFVEVNVDGLLRGDVASRGEFYRQMWNISAITPNEIRAFENLNPMEGGDNLFAPVNMTTLDKAINATPVQVSPTGGDNGTGGKSGGDENTV